MHKLPFALKNGQLVEISQVCNGIKCDCFCPSCGSSLVARKGTKTIHHFAHHNSTECIEAYETALHLAAKEILSKHKKIKIPEVIGVYSVLDHTILHKAQTIYFENAYLEKWSEGLIPDIILEINGRKMYVEIAVTHFITEKKRSRLIEQNISTIEIDLSTMKTVSMTELEDILLNRIDNKKWIYNSKSYQFNNEIGRCCKEYKVTQKGYTLYCPLSVRSRKGSQYAHLVDDCFPCRHYFDRRHDNLSGNEYISCTGSSANEIEKIIAKYTKS